MYANSFIFVRISNMPFNERRSSAVFTPNPREDGFEDTTRPFILEMLNIFKWQ